MIGAIYALIPIFALPVFALAYERGRLGLLDLMGATAGRGLLPLPTEPR